MITVTIAGPVGSGKSLVTHHLRKTLLDLGLKVNFEEKELNAKGVASRLENPGQFVEAINRRGTVVTIVEVQTNRKAVDNEHR